MVVHLDELRCEGLYLVIATGCVAVWGGNKFPRMKILNQIFPIVAAHPAAYLMPPF